MEITAKKKPDFHQALTELKKATAGFEAANKGFADLCRTTWLRRQKKRGRERLFAPLKTNCRSYFTIPSITVKSLNPLHH